MPLDIKLSPDLNWIFDNISRGIYNTNHPISFNKFLILIGDSANYVIFNFILISFFIYILWKKTDKYLFIIITFFILLLNCYFYIQKDNIFLVAFGIYFIYVFNPKLMNLFEELITFLIIFIAFLTFPLFGLLLYVGFLIVCQRRFYYLIIFSLIYLTIYHWQPLHNQYSYSSSVKLNHVIASDAINIAKRIQDYSILPKYFFSDEKSSIKCIKDYDNSTNLINPYGVANIDYIINNGCININTKLSNPEYLAIINTVYLGNFIDYSAVKISHALQLLVRPYNDNVLVYILKIILGPIWLIITSIYFILSRKSHKLLIIFPVYFHFLFIILFAPGYDIRYTYPEFLTLVFLYLNFFKNGSCNKNSRR